MANVLGRFNYISFRKDDYSLVFVPRYGNNLVRIASNMDRDMVVALMEELNKELDYIKEEPEEKE